MNTKYNIGDEVVISGNVAWKVVAVHAHLEGTFYDIQIGDNIIRYIDEDKITGV